MTELELMDLLAQIGIEFRRYDHPAVFTVEQADVYLRDAPGLGTKNFFLRPERPGPFLLLAVLEHKRVDLNRLGKQLGLGKLRFGSPEKLQDMLGLEPGAVTLLAVVNDLKQQVRMLIDVDLWRGEAVQCHPLTNTATLLMHPADLERVLEYSKHNFELIEVPVRAG
jgi:Ala-tRNA(Pro) deacylase